MSTTSPMLSRRVLAQLLRRLRVESRTDIGVAAVHVGCNRTTVQRWEHGQAAPKPPAVRALGELYGASREQLDFMDILSRRSGERGIWERPSVPTELRVLYESELTATAIRSIELELIPGLLQTPAYLRMMQSLVLAPSEQQDAIWQMRQQRQELLWKRRNTPLLQWVIGTSVLRYLDMWPEIRDEQLAEIRRRADSHAIDVRVIDQPHHAMLGSFTLIETEYVSGGDMVPFSFAYIEMLDAGRYVEEVDVVSQYMAAFRAVHESAVPLEEYLK